MNIFQELETEEDNGLDGYHLKPNIDRMVEEHTNGKETAEYCGIPHLMDIFAWKRGFIQLMTGHPNMGKTTFMLYLSVVMAKKYGWKTCIWSPEMLDSYSVNGIPLVSAADIYDEIVFMWTGQTPYKHYEDKYKVKQLSVDVYKETILEIQKYFVVLNTPNNKFETLIQGFEDLDLQFDFDHFIIDPFKNIHINRQGLADEKLNGVLADIKLMNLSKNLITTIVAHPHQMRDAINEDGSIKAPSSYNISGGGAWFQSMDMIMVYNRPDKRKDLNSPATFSTKEKIRKQQLVASPGEYNNITFNWKTNRFLFDGYCPLDDYTVGSENKLPF